MDLRNPKKYPRIPKAVREEASRLLKHYPSQYDMMYIDESFEPLEAIDYEQINLFSADTKKKKSKTK